MFHREVIQREISRVLVLNLSGKQAVLKAPPGKVCLDKAFALIEGHPKGHPFIAERYRLILGCVFCLCACKL